MKICLFPLCLMALWPVVRAQEAVERRDFMPQVRDYTLMYWADGFPSHSPDAPWHRVVQTGHYAFVLDTASMQVPHFGSLTDVTSYEDAVRADNSSWRSLPPAKLEVAIERGGKIYRATEGGKWSRLAGPRLIESGRFLQRADVTDIVFAADDGTKLNTESRFEPIAWADRLALVLAARPGLLPIPSGEPCFGRQGGGFGLDGTNHLEIPHEPEWDPACFTMELWVFVPKDWNAGTKHSPWLLCKGPHEEADGHFGIVMQNGKAVARMNIGGGRNGMVSLESAAQTPIKFEEWNHLVLGYDGDTFRFHVNGAKAAESKVGRPRLPGKGALAIGRRQDGFGDGYHFRGVVDEIRIYPGTLTDEQIRQRFHHPEIVLDQPQALREWSFAKDGVSMLTSPREVWNDAALSVRFTAGGKEIAQRSVIQPVEKVPPSDWHEVGLAFHPATMTMADPTSPLKLEAHEIASGVARPVLYDPVRGWHRIDLNGIEPILPPGATADRSNDAIERVRLSLENTGDNEQEARLLFVKESGGFRQKIGSAITGISAILRDGNGNPTGIPVQLSKNWHNNTEKSIYSGQWFHGFSQVRLPPHGKLELELTLAYGHWGGVAAASHAQLSLIGWGGNQLWDQSALGSWGESICYEPDQIQGDCSILDVRPVMVRSMNGNQSWQWTHNVGGGDFFRVFTKEGRRLPHVGMRTAYRSHGPCLTEVTYAGRVGNGISHSETVSLARTDDLVRGVYQIRLDVQDPIDFSRLVFFQIGADTYSYTSERKMAVGNESGLTREWQTQWGDDVYRGTPMEGKGAIPWVSLHDAVPRREAGQQGSWANRGIIIRSWKARLGGKDAAPWFAERGVKARGSHSSTVDIVPPPGINRLEKGDFLEAVIEHLILPQAADEYYGPNNALREALKEHGNSWQLIQREALGNQRKVTMETGHLEKLHPAVSIRVVDDRAAFMLEGGLGYVPLAFNGLSSPGGHVLLVDGTVVNQSVHGNDFWQADYEAADQTWRLTYTVALPSGKPCRIQLTKQP